MANMNEAIPLKKQLAMGKGYPGTSAGGKGADTGTTRPTPVSGLKKQGMDVKTGKAGAKRK